MKYLLFGITVALLFSCADTKPGETENPLLSNADSVLVLDKMSGVSLEMPGQPMEGERMDGILDFGVKWVALIPYGYTERGKAKVNYSWDGRWWGESLNGTAKCIEFAQERGLKTMLKPHVWVVGQGWPGDFDLTKESDWQIWESSYREYILDCARLADSMEVDVFCIGTEYRKSVVKRSDFWKKLIKEVREIYSGPMTYAANWDNYEKVNFWDQLDFIGIDAYFPLSKEREPALEELKTGWINKSKELKAFSEKWNRKIAFTEYGFKSVDFMYGGSKSNEDLKPNMTNQETGYSAFFNTVWKEEWMLGGFLWKWHFSDGAGGENNTRYTPQNKPAQKIVKAFYGVNSESN
ncbi:MAG: glycoside hydrolase TIM-barrel-like domain-containing protein [Crocinitomicaceae bacterium]